MARIRSIHPDILTDPDFAEICRDARLLFIYSLIVADDPGNLEDSPRALKMACFPGDDDLPVARIEELRDALLSGRFYESYEADGKRYLHIRNFAKYQKPDHPTAPKHPLAPGQTYTYHLRQGNTFISKTEKGPLSERSENVRGTLPERKANVLAGEEWSGTGLERRGKELEGTGKEGRGAGREGKHGKKKTHAEGPLPLEGGGASSPSIKGNGEDTTRSSGKKGKRPDFAIIANLVAHIHDEDVQCRVVKAYDAVSSGTMEVDDALELLDQAEIGVRIRAELSQMFRSARHAAN
jgi:hypothetical protein